jgi:hypothetical protein
LPISPSGSPVVPSQLSGQPAPPSASSRATLHADLQALLDGVTKLNSSKVESATVVDTVMETVGANVVAGANVTVSYNSATNTLTIAASGGGGGSPTSDLYYPTVQDTLTASSEGQTVFTSSINAGVRKVALVKVGGEVYGPFNFTHSGTTLTLTNGLSAPNEASVVLIYRGD